MSGVARAQSAGTRTANQKTCSQMTLSHLLDCAPLGKAECSNFTSRTAFSSRLRSVASCGRRRAEVERALKVHGREYVIEGLGPSNLQYRPVRAIQILCRARLTVVVEAHRVAMRTCVMYNGHIA